MKTLRNIQAAVKNFLFPRKAWLATPGSIISAPRSEQSDYEYFR